VQRAPFFNRTEAGGTEVLFVRLAKPQGGLGFGPELARQRSLSQKFVSTRRRIFFGCRSQTCNRFRASRISVFQETLAATGKSDRIGKPAGALYRKGRLPPPVAAPRQERSGGLYWPSGPESGAGARRKRLAALLLRPLQLSNERLFHEARHVTPGEKKTTSRAFSVRARGN
jgi:hypothetical protein